MSIQDLLELMSRALEGLSGLPWGVHLAVALALAAGLIIWLIGERFLRPMVVMLCAGVGGVLGLLLTSVTPWGQSGSFSPYAHMFVGLGVGAVLGMLVFRSAAALALGVVLSGLLPLGAAAVLTFVAGARDHDAQASLNLPTWTLPHMDAQPVVRRVALLQAAGETLTGDPADPTPSAAPANPAERAKEAVRVEEIPTNLQPGVEAVEQFWATLGDEARSGWSKWSTQNQAILVTVGALGMVIGVIWGMGLPKWSGVALSAMFGAAVWLPAFVWLSNAMSAPWRTALDRSPLHWLIIWAGVGVLGMIVQYAGIIPGSKPKSGGSAAVNPKTTAR